MKVFISWSGENSKKYAETLYNWLPSVLQLVKPYFTPSDVEKGTRWNTEIGKELESSEIGILCVTRDNLHSEWIMFEAGALSKSLDKAHVCPILFGIQNTDLAGPLRQFQTTEFEKSDVKKLITVINNKLGENKLPLKILDSVFEKWWPELENGVNEILATVDDDCAPIRPERELLEEVLALTRTIASDRTPRISPNAIVELAEKFIELHNKQAEGDGGYQQTLDAMKEMERSISYLVGLFANRDPRLKNLAARIDGLTFSYESIEIPDDDIPF